MREHLIKLSQQRETLIDEMESIHRKATEENRDLTAEEQSAWDAKVAAIESLDRKIDREQKLADARQVRPGIADTAAVVEDMASQSAPAAPKVEIPLPRRDMKCFKGPQGHERAFRFGMWLKSIARHPGAMRYCAEHGLTSQWMDLPQGRAVDIGAAYGEGTNTAGGYLVLPEFDRDIIRLVDEYGVARRLARISPMTAETKSRPRRTGGLNAYFVGEGTAGTGSTGSWDTITLVAKKLMVLALVSNELNADAIINMADNIAVEMATAFAYKEDLCFIDGDGTSTYGGITGLRPKLAQINGTDDGGGLTLGSGSTWSALTLADFDKMAGRLPLYARQNAVWLCSPEFYGAVMERLMNAAGGNTAAILAGGLTQDRFKGRPVVLSAAMPTATGTSQICALFGNFAQAADFGDRQQLTIAMSDSAYVDSTSTFATDQIAFRATERFDINVHDVGTATASGPVIGLITAAS